MSNANSQAMKAGKKYSKSFFLVSSMFVRASWAGLRCSQEQTGAGSSGREDQQQFHVGLVSGVARATSSCVRTCSPINVDIV